MEESIITENDNEIAIIYLNEPKSLNALSSRLKEQLLITLEKVEKDDDVKFVVFTGNGKAFCAGGDVKAMRDPYDPLAIKKGMDLSKQIVEKIRSMQKLTTAAVHGYAAGAGMSIALATDLIFAEVGTKFVLSFKNVGLIPDLGLHYYLPKKIGDWKTKEWMWTGKTLTTEEAIAYGLIMEEVEKGKVLDRALEFARELIDGPIESYIASKSIINSSRNMKIEDILERENAMQSLLRGTEAHQQAVHSFFSRKE